VPCYYPMSGWRQPSGSVVLGRRGESRALEQLQIPCGRCVGCRLRRARDWSIRCGLELSLHDTACWATLTYDDAHLPPTLSRSHLSGFIKRLRARVEPLRFRFFASGEYGERLGRPHYHVILFGLSTSFDLSVSGSWPFGFSRLDAISPASIAYVCGYTSKKAADCSEPRGERLDVRTGELYEFQPSFLQMSRRPGIGGASRSHWRSWRDSAIVDGDKVPVPRYLHQAYLDNASDSQLQHLSDYKESFGRKPYDELMAGAAIARSRIAITSDGRKL
jgi:hypothetical protein